MWLPAFTVPKCLARDEWSRHLVARVGASSLAMVALVSLPQMLPALGRWTDAACAFRGLTGLPCPGCGITTSLLALARGDAQASWAANPAGFAVMSLLVGQAVVAAVAMRRDASVRRGLSWLTYLDRMVIGALAAVWVGRLTGALS